MSVSEAALRQMPKAELHRQPDGSVRPRTIWELARRHGPKLGASTLEELRSRATITAPMRDLEEHSRPQEIRSEGLAGHFPPADIGN